MTNSSRSTQSFRLGRVYITPGIQSLSINYSAYLARHSMRDWGDLCDEDKAANNLALSNGSRILSAYETPKGKIWIITEADWSATTILLPDEY